MRCLARPFSLTFARPFSLIVFARSPYPSFSVSRSLLAGNDCLRAPSLFGAASVWRVSSERHETRVLLFFRHVVVRDMAVGRTSLRVWLHWDIRNTSRRRWTSCVSVSLACRAGSEINCTVGTRGSFCSLEERDASLRPFSRPVSPRDSRQVE